MIAGTFWRFSGVEGVVHSAIWRGDRAGVSIFELPRVMGASVREIDRTYGHLVRDSEDAIRARLEARAASASSIVGNGEPG